MKILLSTTLLFGVLGVIALGVFIFKGQLPSSDTLTASLTDSEQPESATLEITVQPSSVHAGESISITISPKQGRISPQSLVDVRLAHSAGSAKAARSIVNIDGEGRRFGSIIIPVDAQPGTWIVKSVEIDERDGNINSYKYGEDIFTTFTVL